MEIKQHLLEAFRFNDRSNKLALAQIKELPDKAECIKLFSHLINSQIKWLARIKQFPQAPDLDWWDPVYELENLEAEWDKCLKSWLDFIGTKSEEELNEEVKFVGFDGGQWAGKLKDIALQLNYHSVHHRAIIQYQIRKQGLTPNFVDYIGGAVRKL